MRKIPNRRPPVISCKFFIRKGIEVVQITKIKKGKDKRTKSRKSFSGNILFITKNGFNEGRLKNFSRYGLFIETTENLSVGEIITVALPHIKGKNIKCKGQIMWRDNQGCGAELFRKRSSTNLRIIK